MVHESHYFFENYRYRPALIFGFPQFIDYRDCCGARDKVLCCMSVFFFLGLDLAKKINIVDSTNYNRHIFGGNLCIMYDNKTKDCALNVDLTV